MKKLIERKNAKGKLYLDEVKNRKIFVWIPDCEENEKLPVLYTFDGQVTMAHPINFEGFGEHQHWDLDNTIERLYNENKCKKMIITGFFNEGGDRFKEYVPYLFEESKAFIKLLTESLIQHIEDNYNVKKGKQNRALIGASMAGLMAIYIFNNYSEYFGFIAAFSPHDPWLEGNLENHTKNDTKLWIDSGTEEYYDNRSQNTPAHDLFKAGMTHKLGAIYSYANGSRAILNTLIEKSYKFGEDIFYLEELGAGHGEYFWKKRIENFLIMFTGKKYEKIKDFEIGISILKDKFFNTKYFVNSVAELDNGIKTSLYNLGSYFISNDASISSLGEITNLNDEEFTVTVTYQDITKTLKSSKEKLIQDELEILQRLGGA